MNIDSSPFHRYFDTDYAPTSSEIKEINTYISTRQANLGDIESKLAELDRSRRELKDAKIFTMEAINRHHNLTTFVRRLPPDILSFIFLLLPGLYTPDASLHPVVAVTHVCHQWRRIALDMPLLWAHISISTPTQYPEVSLAAFHWQLHVESSCARAETFLQRSGGCQVHVTIMYRDPTEDPQCRRLVRMHAANKSGTNPSHQFLGVLRAMKQKCWESTRLSFTVNPHEPLGLIFLRAALQGPSGVGRLTIDVGYNKPGEVAEDIWHELGGNLKLQPASLTSLTTRMGIAEIRRIDADWASLTELAIVDPTTPGEPFRLDEAVMTLVQAPNLAKLALDITSGIWAPSSPDELRISLLRLKHLTIHGDRPPKQLADCLHLPSLTHLSTSPCTRHDPQDEAESALVCIIRNHGQQLLDVSFSYETLTLPALAYTLDQLRNVEVLELTTYGQVALRSSNAPEGPVPPRLASSLDSMIPKLTPILDDSRAIANPTEFACPRLRRLDIGLAETIEEIKGGVLDLIEARRRKDQDRGPVRWLEQVGVYFDRGSVEGMRDELRSRGVETRGVQLTVRVKYL